MKGSTMKVFRAVFLLAGMVLVGADAFAIDQVTLTNGQVVEGTVLNEVPGRHVDIRLINGQTRRFQHSEVSGVERDVPSTSDRSVLGNESRLWGSLLLGGYLNLTSTGTSSVYGSGTTLLFDFGAKLGLSVANLDFAWLAFALGYDYVSDSNANSGSGMMLQPSRSYHDLNLQMLLTRVGESGFYFGPTGGIAIVPAQSPGLYYSTSSASTSYLELGAVGGYDFFFSKSFSAGPEVRFQHIFTSEANVLKFALQLGLHF
ncbi:MAG: hypothetical protein EBX52_04160 [Proteobacteria bacterium]|nr:hypothetical protein [Pseudomonadota bacterium]